MLKWESTSLQVRRECRIFPVLNCYMRIFSSILKIVFLFLRQNILEYLVTETWRSQLMEAHSIEISTLRISSVTQTASLMSANGLCHLLLTILHKYFYLLSYHIFTKNLSYYYRKILLYVLLLRIIFVIFL